MAEDYNKFQNKCCVQYGLLFDKISQHAFLYGALLFFLKYCVVVTVLCCRISKMFQFNITSLLHSLNDGIAQLNDGNSKLLSEFNSTLPLFQQPGKTVLE